MNNCLDVLNAQHFIQNKIEMKYNIKEQLPGCIKHTENYSTVIIIINKRNEQLSGCIKRSARYSK